MNRKRDPAAAGSLRFSIYGIALDYGKEDSYERNPGGVSFVFNHPFFDLFEGSKNLLSAVKSFFAALRRPGICRAAFLGSEGAYRLFS